VLKGLYLPPGNEPSNHALTTPPPAAATTTRAATTTASLGSSTRAKSLPSPQVQAARSNTSAQVTQNIPIQNHASPLLQPKCILHLHRPYSLPSPFKRLVWGGLLLLILLLQSMPKVTIWMMPQASVLLKMEQGHEDVASIFYIRGQRNIGFSYSKLGKVL